MIKRIALPVLALLFSANAQQIVDQASNKGKSEAQIAKVKQDVEKIAQT